MRTACALSGMIVRLGDHYELLQEILVLFLGGRSIILVLHLEHDGDDLGSCLVHLAEDVIALAAGPRGVVLGEQTKRLSYNEIKAIRELRSYLKTKGKELFPIASLTLVERAIGKLKSLGVKF